MGAAGRATGREATIMAGAIAACRRRVRKNAKAEAALPTLERTTGYSVGTKVLTATVKRKPGTMLPPKPKPGASGGAASLEGALWAAGCGKEGSSKAGSSS